MHIEYASLLAKIESLVEEDHISEKEYLDIAMIFKEHRENSSVERVESLVRMMQDADLALTEGIRLEYERDS